MERWSGGGRKGVLECWSVGVMEYRRVIEESREPKRRRVTALQDGLRALCAGRRFGVLRLVAALDRVAVSRRASVGGPEGFLMGLAARFQERPIRVLSCCRERAASTPLAAGRRLPASSGVSLLGD